MAVLDLRISLNGQDISSRLMGRILRGRVARYDGNKADDFTLLISNYDGKIAKPAHGAQLSVALGTKEFGLYPRGNFLVQDVAKIGPKAAFEICAQAADFKKSLKTQKNRSWQAPKKMGDALAQIAKDNGLRPAISQIYHQTPIPALLAQNGESDMHFCTRIARQYGAIFKIGDGRLVFTQRGAGERSTGAAMPALTLTPNDFVGENDEGFRINSKDRPRRSKIRSPYWDRLNAKKQYATAGEDGEDGDYTFPYIFASQQEAQAAADARAREFASQ